jgi:CrcB protein
MMNILLVGIGGFAGSISRYLLGGWIQRTSGESWLFLGTAAVNLTGCLLIGLIANLASVRSMMSDEMRILLIVGLLGGFTTFSSFGLENFHLIRDTRFLVASMNILVQVILGVGGVMLGNWMARLF